MLTRRDFIRNAAMTVAAGIALPRFLQADLLQAAKKNAKVSPSDKFRVGLIGCRNMGGSNLNSFLLLPEVDCVALCDVKEEYLNTRAKKVMESRTTKPLFFSDYRKMIEMKDLDAVIVGTPDHWHCLMMVDACAAGKDVYVEKPIANSIAECDIMVRAAQKYNRVVQVGQQQRSGEDWAGMVEYLRSGQLGRVAKVDVWGNFPYAAGLAPQPDSQPPADLDYDMWLGPAPLRTFNEGRWNRYWRMYWHYGGGLMTDWGVHLLDMGLWGLDKTGMPKSVSAHGGKYMYPDYASETPDTMTVIYDFGDVQMNWLQCTSPEKGFYDRSYGLAFRGVKGTLVANRSGWEVIPIQGSGLEVKKVEGDEGKCHRDHCRQFVEKAKAREFDMACTIERGSLCAKYSHIGNIAMRVGKTLVYDDVAGKFNDTEANNYITPTYRAPWKLPNI